MCRLLTAFIFVAFPVAAALGVAQPGLAQQAPAGTPAVALASLDRSADPCVDFYQYACGGWMAGHPIPSDRSTWATFDELQDRNDQKLRDILETAAATPTAETRKIGDYYGSCMDETAINAKLQGWGAVMQSYKDLHVAAYHDSWPYFAHRFGLKIDIFLEPKPGIPPSPSHLTEVIGQMKSNHVKAIIVEPYHDRRIAEKVARSTDAKVIDFSQYPGGIPGTDSYVSLIDQLVKRLADALK